MYKELFNIKEYKFNWTHVAIVLVFLFPLFVNTLRHWVSAIYVLIVLFSFFSIKKYTYDLRKEEQIFLLIFILHVISSAISNSLSGWTYASKTWFVSGDVRFIFAIPIYLYLRTVPEIWRYFVVSLPLSASIIGVTGVVDFGLRTAHGEASMILAEGVYGHIFQGNISALLSVLSFATIDYFRNSNKMRMLCLAGAVLGAAGALLSVTRNAWLSIILLYALLFILQGGLIKVVSSLGWQKIVLMVSAIVVVLYIMSGFSYVRDRVAQIYEEPVMYFTADRSKPIEYRSLTFRLEQWRGVIYAFEEKPIFGHGVGNSGIVHNRYIREGRLNSMIYQEPTEKYGSPSHVHSAYFEYLGDTGLVGFILILLVLFYAPYVAYRMRHNNGLAWKFVILHGAAFGIASLTEVPFIRNNWTSVFIITGVIFFIWLAKDQEQFEKNEIAINYK